MTRRNCLIKDSNTYKQIYERTYFDIEPKNNKKLSNKDITRMIVTSAILMALASVLKMFGIMITTEMRISFFQTPLILAGLMNGFGFGIVTSIGADLVYSLFSGYAFNPAFTLSAIYWGVLGAILRLILKKKGSLKWLVVGIGVLITSILETHTNLLVTYILYGSGTTLMALLTKYAVLIIKLPLITIIVTVLYNRVIKKLKLIK